jgi:hypothetical protein
VVAQLSTLGHFRHSGFVAELLWLAEDLSSEILMSRLPIVRMLLARAGSRGGQVRSRRICGVLFAEFVLYENAVA